MLGALALPISAQQRVAPPPAPAPANAQDAPVPYAHPDADPYSVVLGNEDYTRVRDLVTGHINTEAYRRAVAHSYRMPTINADALRQILASKKGQRAAAAFGGGYHALGGGGGGTTTWQAYGPTQLTTRARSIFGGSYATGPINAAAYDPNNANTIYIAAQTGGLWRSLNSGSTWTPLTDAFSDSYGPAYAFSSITIDPRNSNILYAGVGDYNATFALGNGILKSTDGGATWTRLGTLEFGSRIVRKILVDASDSNILYATAGRDSTVADLTANWPPAANGVIYRSTDGGASWTSVITAVGYGSNIVYNSDKTKLYASVDGSGIYRSADGITWTLLDGTDPTVIAPQPAPLTSSYRLDVAASVNDPNTVYFISEAQRRIYKSTVSGDQVMGNTSFVNVAGAFPSDFSTFGDNLRWASAANNLAINCSQAFIVRGGRGTEPPVNPPDVVVKEVVYVSTLDVVQSLDGGRSWQIVTQVNTPNAQAFSHFNGIVVNQNNPNINLVFGNGGIWRFVYDPNNNVFRFASLNQNLSLIQALDGAYHPTSATTALIAGTVLGAQRTLGGGFGGPVQVGGSVVSRWESIVTDYTSHVAIDQGVPATQYALTGSGAGVLLAQTDNSWKTSITTQPSPATPVGVAPPLELNMANTGFAYTGGAKIRAYTYKEPDANGNAQAGTWADFGGALGNPLDTANDYISAISASARSANIVYAGTSEGLVWYLLDGTEHRIDRIGYLSGLPGGPLARPVVALVGSTQNPKRLYVVRGGTGTGKIFRCDDITDPLVPDNDNGSLGGPIWDDISGTGATALPDVPTSKLIVMPNDDEQTLFVANDLGVYVTLDGGANWARVTAPGLPNAPVTNLAFQPSTGYLHATTFGRGAWRLLVGNNLPLQVQPRLQYWLGDKTKLTVKVDLYRAGQVVLPDTPGNLPRLYTPPAESRSGSLTAFGYFNTNISSVGAYDMYISVPRFLRKKIFNKLTNDIPVITDQLINGDVNGDNTIDILDYRLVLRALGARLTDNRDLDGDNRVTVRDLNIVIKNFGLTGD